VVTGSGQNAWRECDVAQIERDGVTLARRPSGGGAVFHDLGNLNFSFLMPREDYDVLRQLGVILRAVQSFGIHAEVTGRNDLTVDGRKFSGNAFRFYQDRALHHGTLLLHADMARGSRYLTVDPEKLKSKGVTSVRSRVVNLGEYASVSVEAMRDALQREFEREYGAADVVDLDREQIPHLDERVRKYASWEWNYAASPSGEVQWENRFEWGGIQLYFSLREGRITGVKAFTDAMDECLAQKVASALEGCFYRAETIRECLVLWPDLAEWLCGKL